jgi:hypothetical protein
MRGEGHDKAAQYPQPWSRASPWGARAHLCSRRRRQGAQHSRQCSPPHAAPADRVILTGPFRWGESAANKHPLQTSCLQSMPVDQHMHAGTCGRAGAFILSNNWLAGWIPAAHTTQARARSSCVKWLRSRFAKHKLISAAVTQCRARSLGLSWLDGLSTRGLESIKSSARDIRVEQSCESLCLPLPQLDCVDSAQNINIQRGWLSHM